MEVQNNVKKLVLEMPILWIEDAAFDSGDLMSDRHDDGDNFIIRHNMRQESQKELIKTAMEQRYAVGIRPDKDIYRESDTQARLYGYTPYL
jgi:hypothetical protein